MSFTQVPRPHHVTWPASLSALRTGIERIIESPANYWLVMVSDVCWALLFLLWGLTDPPASAVTAGVSVVGGFFGWGLLEYVLHRWVLHGPPSLARTSHARHHGDVHALLSAPLFVALICMLAIRGLLLFAVSPGSATLCAFGVYAGYNYFSLLHHLHHALEGGAGRTAYWDQLQRRHDVHHHHARVNFGVTTSLWDRVFGTFDPEGRTPRSGAHDLRTEHGPKHDA